MTPLVGWRACTASRSPAPLAPTTFRNHGGYDQLVAATGIPGHSLPFLAARRPPALYGRLRDDPRTRPEFLSPIGGSRV